MEKYLDEVKAKRYLELLKHGDINSFVETGNYKEFCALSDESLARQKEIYGGSRRIPFDGHCRRCGREFSNPIPKVTHPEGIHEIACVEWCAECNAYTMSMVFRESSAFRVPVKNLRDPMKGGREDAG